MKTAFYIFVLGAAILLIPLPLMGWIAGTVPVWVPMTLIPFGVLSLRYMKTRGWFDD